MKKLIPLLALVGAMTGYSQTVNFNNNVLTAPPERLVRQSDGSALVGQNYTAVLLYGTSDTSLTPHTGTAQFRVPTTSIPGTWQGGSRTLTGFSAGQAARLQVAVYDNTRYSSYAAALAAGEGVGILGRSIIFDYTVPTTPPAPGADSMLNFVGFTLVPEPSVIGLGLIGAGALFLLRRRK